MTRALAAGVAEPAAAGLGAGLAAGPGLEVAEVALGFGPRAGRSDARPAGARREPVAFAPALPADRDAVRAPLERWRAGRADLDAVDEKADELGLRGLAPVVAAGDPAARVQLLVRCQRWLDRRNAASSGAWFDAVLRDHARLHDRSLPLVRADHNHALDTWQWTLRLDPGASAAVQLAALFHDVERLESEAEKRIEHHAADHAAFKRAHAAGSAAWLERLVAGTSAARFAPRAAALIAAGDQVRGAGGATAELQLLEDADSLSFFSLNSGGFLDYYGPDHTVRKIRWTLARMSARAHAALAGVHLRHDVAALRGAIPGR